MYYRSRKEYEQSFNGQSEFQCLDMISLRPDDGDFEALRNCRRNPYCFQARSVRKARLRSMSHNNIWKRRFIQHSRRDIMDWDGNINHEFNYGYDDCCDEDADITRFRRFCKLLSLLRRNKRG